MLSIMSNLRLRLLEQFLIYSKIEWKGQRLLHGPFYLLACTANTKTSDIRMSTMDAG
jgi:hypothetical protein